MRKMIYEYPCNDCKHPCEQYKQKYDCCDFCQWFYEGDAPCNFCKKKNSPHWIAENERPKSFKWICSECGSVVYDMPMCGKKNYKKMCMYQFCPYCGVKMDLSKEDKK